MGYITIPIDISNAAFEGESLGPEVARILRNLADRIEGQSRADIKSCIEARGFNLKDANGNTIGFATGALEDELTQERDNDRG